MLFLRPDLSEIIAAVRHCLLIAILEITFGVWSHLVFNILLHFVSWQYNNQIESYKSLCDQWFYDNIWMKSLKYAAVMKCILIGILVLKLGILFHIVQWILLHFVSWQPDDWIWSYRSLCRYCFYHHMCWMSIRKNRMMQSLPDCNAAESMDSFTSKIVPFAIINDWEY